MTLHGPSIPIQVHIAEPDPGRLSDAAPELPDREPAAPASELPASEPEPAPMRRRGR